MSKNTEHEFKGVSIDVGHKMPSTTFYFLGESYLCFYPDGRVTFTGKLDEATQIFFDEVAKKYVHYLEILRNQNAHLSAKLNELQDKIYPPMG